MRFRRMTVAPRGGDRRYNATFRSRPSVLHANGPWWAKKKFRTIYDGLHAALSKTESSRREVLAFPFLFLDASNYTCRVDAAVGKRYSTKSTLIGFPY